MNAEPNSYPAPFEDYRTSVPPDWIDLNGHMNAAYYGVVFERGNSAAGTALGFDPDYAQTRHFGIFAVEAHTLYFGELKLGDRLKVRTQILGMDAKRMHVAHEIFKEDSIFRQASARPAAAQEVIYLHVDLAARKAAAFPDDLRPALEAAVAAHRQLAVPDWCGRRLAL